MIPFTQYMLPRGERRQTEIERPPDIEDHARQLIAAGYKFEIEILRTGQVSMTCTPTDEDEADELGDLAHEICNNGPDVPIRTDKLVRDAVDELARRRKP